MPKCLVCNKTLSKRSAKNCKRHREISEKTRLKYSQRMKGNSFAKGKNIGNTYNRGRVPWNKGKSNFWLSGQSNHMWRGDKVGYRALHSWICRQKGSPRFCEQCEAINLRKRQYHWANRSGNYLRILSDWVRLCVKCHKNYDLVRLSRKDC